MAPALASWHRIRSARARTVLVPLLIASLVVATAMAGPVAVTAEAKPRCRPGYKVQVKRGVRRCVRKPTLVPSSIVLIVGKLEDGRFGATGYMEFPKTVTGLIYGKWVFRNGIGRETARFDLGYFKRINYTPFTTGYPIKVGISGPTVTATLVIGGTRSNAITLRQ